MGGRFGIIASYIGGPHDEPLEFRTRGKHEQEGSFDRSGKHAAGQV